MNYTVIRKPKRKTASVSVAPDNSVSVIVPDRLTDEEVESVVHDKRQWILKKKALNNEVRKPARPKAYVSGEAFSYLGRNYRLKVIVGAHSRFQVDGTYPPCLILRRCQSAGEGGICISLHDNGVRKVIQ